METGDSPPKQPRSLCSHSASELAALIRAREVSCTEVVEAHLARIEEVNGQVHAVTRVLRESALKAAALADRSKDCGPLHGVPFAIKENIDCLGSPTTHGVPALRDALPYLDAPIVARMKAAGAIPLARTNLSELGLRLCTINPLHGRTLNLWNARLTIGGSSGGDAAAVATGMIPMSLGNDMGGSLRIPAHCAGIATLKATTGRVPHASSLDPHDYGLSGQLMLAHGPMARSVADLKLCLSVLSGRDVRDPRSVDVPLFGKAVDEPRVALVTELPGLTLPKSHVEAIERAGALLETAGWTVEQATPPELSRVSEIWAQLVSSDFSVVMPKLRPVVSEALYDHMERVCKAHDYRRVTAHFLHTERSRLQRAWSGFLSDYTIALGPTWGVPVWPVDSDLHPTRGIPLLEDTVSFITPGNALGLPALTLPVGLSDGLPSSVQIYADLWREDLCLEAAEIIERGAPRLTPLAPLV